MGRKDRGPWQDPILRRLAKKQVTLPVEVTELTHAELRRKTNRLILVMIGLEFAVFAILFAVMGIFPGFVDETRFTALDANAEFWLAVVLLSLPLGTGLLVRWLIGPRIRRRPDEADHPWRFRLTAEGMEVATPNDRRLAGSWPSWTYRGYRYLSVKGNRIPIGLVVACDGTEIAIEFSRFRRRESATLIRGVLQGLASAGNTDR